MTQAQLRQIQDCMEVLRKTIHQITGSEKCVVGFAVIQDLEKDNIACGTQHGPVLESELRELSFELISSLCRLYETDDDNPDEQWKKPS